MAYAAMDFAHLLGMPGFSDALLQNHFSLYEGYVKHTNKAAETLSLLEKEGKGDSLEYQEVKRHFGWEFDGMRLHEYYFDNLGGTGDPNSAPDLQRLLGAKFGSYASWEKDFRDTGAVRGAGWAILYQDSMTGRLHNLWINEHDKGHAAGCIPILVMDAWEHAYMLDYGIRRADYVNSFFRNIHWQKVRARVSMELVRQYA